MNWPYTTIGSSNHPPLVFLHGFMGQGNNWAKIATRLAIQYQCFMPSLPGHGPHIERSLEQDINFKIIAQEFIAWLDSLGLLTITLVGYSMGGRIALYIATHYPHRINHLVLESANPGLPTTTEREKRLKLDQKRAAELLSGGVNNFVERWYSLGLFASIQQRPTLLTQVKQKRIQNNAAWLAKIIVDLSPGRQMPLWPHLAHLPMPVLLITGALDKKYVTIMQKITKHRPQAALTIIPQAGHNVHLEKPEAFIKCILSAI